MNFNDIRIWMFLYTIWFRLFSFFHFTDVSRDPVVDEWILGPHDLWQGNDHWIDLHFQVFNVTKKTNFFFFSDMKCSVFTFTVCRRNAKVHVIQWGKPTMVDSMLKTLVLEKYFNFVFWQVLLVWSFNHVESTRVLLRNLRRQPDIG